MRELIRSEFENLRLEMVSSIRSELPDIKSKTSDLDGQVRLLKQNSSCSTGQPSSSPLVTDGIIVELNDRQIRASNLIIHGLPESPNISPDLARGKDLEGVSSILNQI